MFKTVVIGVLERWEEFGEATDETRVKHRICRYDTADGIYQRSV
jgi:hypothetical protein